MDSKRSIIAFLVAAIAAAALWSGGLPASPARHEAAHEHGAAALSIVVEDRAVYFEFESPAANIIGFEHEAKSPQDRAKKKAAMDKLADIASILVFDASAKCRLTTQRLEWKVETHGGSGTHSIVEGEFKAVCEKSVQGTRLKTYFTKIFPTLQTIRATIISGEKQNAVVIQSDKPAVEL